MKPPRPKADKPSAELHFRLPAEQYDEIYTRAHRERVTVPEWVRKAIYYRILRQNLDDE